MDLESLFATPTDALRAAIQAELRGMFTTLPGILASQGDGHNASANSAITGLVRAVDGTTTQVAMPEFPTLPVHFAGGGSVVSTHPLHQNDEGILLFAARALDSWRQNGGKQSPIDSRQHSLSDGFWLGGVKSDPNKLPNYAPDSIHHRSVDGKVTHEVHPTGGVTTKVVDPGDASSNPFSLATTFHSTVHNAIAGIVHTATDGNNLHTSTLQKAAGFALKIASSIANHSMSLSPSGGHQVSVANLVNTALHTLNLTPSGGFSAMASNPTAGTSASIGISPSGVLSLAASAGLSLPAGGVSGSALASGAAANNPGWNTLPAYANNAAAIAGGVAVGSLYVNTSIAGGEHVVCVAH